MSLTTRVSIQWGDRPASEPTDALVLTAPSQQFVDLRRYKQHKAQHEPFPFDWAFCGSMIHGKNGKVRYTHDIDSRRLQGLPDEQDIGYTTVQPNGDERETGAMYNPDTQQKENFVEVWRPLNVLSSDREPLPKEKQTDASATPVCVLATVDGQNVNGKVVRVGHWMQAVLEIDGDGGMDDRFACARSRLKDDKWTTEFTYGNNVDKLVTNGFSQMVVGQVIEHNGVTWAVIEHNDSPQVKQSALE